MLDKVGNRIVVPNGVRDYKYQINEQIKGSGKIECLEMNLDRSKKLYHRALIRAKLDLFDIPACYVKSEAYKIDSKTRLKGLIEFTVFRKRFQLYSFDHDQGGYIVIDSITKTSFEEFETIFNAIIYSFGLISGNYFGGELSFLGSNDRKFKKLISYRLETAEESIMTRSSVLPYQIMVRTEWGASDRDGKMDVSTFKDIVRKVLAKKELLRVTKLVCHGNGLPLEMRAAVYSVALETLRNIILDGSPKGDIPFSSKKSAKIIVSKLLELVESQPDSHFSSRSTIENKIKNINQRTNTESFRKAFQTVGMELSEDDQQCLDQRNKFLHGKIPFQNESESKTQIELKHATLKMHFLVCCLLFKFCKFSGYVLNTSKLFSLMNSGKSLDESIYRRI